MAVANSQDETNHQVAPPKYNLQQISISTTADTAKGSPSSLALSYVSLTSQLGLQLVELCAMPLRLLQGSVQLGAQIHLLLLMIGELQLKPGDLCCGSC